MAGKQPGDLPKFMQICDAFGNLFILNLIFVLCCLPVITIGASINALCTMIIRLYEQRERKLVKDFFVEFKKGFLNSTIIWMVYVVISLLVYSEYTVLKGLTGDVRMLIIVLVGIEVIFVATTFPYIFWLNARYNNTIKNMFINSFLLFVKRFGTWFKIVVIWAGPIVFMAFFTQVFAKAWFLWVVILISFLTYVCCMLMKREFNLLEGKTAEGVTKVDETNNATSNNSNEEDEN